MYLHTLSTLQRTYMWYDQVFLHIKQVFRADGSDFAELRDDLLLHLLEKLAHGGSFLHSDALAMAGSIPVAVHHIKQLGHSGECEYALMVVGMDVKTLCQRTSCFVRSCCASHSCFSCSFCIASWRSLSRSGKKDVSTVGSLEIFFLLRMVVSSSPLV